MLPIYESAVFDVGHTSAEVFDKTSKLHRKTKLTGVDTLEEYVDPGLFFYSLPMRRCTEWDRRDRFNIVCGFGLRVRPMSRYPAWAIW